MHKTQGVLTNVSLLREKLNRGLPLTQEDQAWLNHRRNIYFIPQVILDIFDMRSILPLTGYSLIKYPEDKANRGQDKEEGSNQEEKLFNVFEVKENNE